jgi:NAD-dependent DNA ligase
MEQQEYDELVRRLVAVSEQHEKTLAGIDSTLRHLEERQETLGERQQGHEDIMKSLAATLVKQDTINDTQQRINERLRKVSQRC